MKNILLIGVKTIKAESVIEQNVDDRLLAKTIATVQEVQLRPILGTSLYDTVCTAVKAKVEDSTEIVEPYKTLIDDYIQPFLTYATVADFIAISNFKISNKGIQKLTDSSSSSASNADAEYFKNYYDNYTATYKDQLVKYLKAADLLPKDKPTDTNIQFPATGWFLKESPHDGLGFNYESLPDNPTLPEWTETDPIWEADKAHYYTKAEVDGLIPTVTPTPTLQSVTDAGNDTTNQIYVHGSIDSNIIVGTNKGSAALRTDSDGLGELALSNNSGFGIIKGSNITADRVIQLPDASGTIALTSDITGGGIPSLTSTQIGFGDGSNLLSGSEDLTFDGSQFKALSALNINGAQGLNEMGDFNNNVNGSKITVDASNAQAYVITNDADAHPMKFGINTNTPTVALDVVGDANISSTGITTIGDYDGSTNGLFAQIDNTNNVISIAKKASNVGIQLNYNSNFITIGDGSGNINRTYAAIDIAAKMAFFRTNDNDIKFGINSSSPTQALDVNGNAQVSGTVSNNNGVIQPFKVYTALLNQRGTGDPIATILQNTLGSDIVWTRGGLGSYIGTSSGAFTIGKTIIFINSAVSNSPILAARSNDSSINLMNILSFTPSPGGGVGFVDIGGDISIEIRVYN